MCPTRAAAANRFFLACASLLLCAAVATAAPAPLPAIRIALKSQAPRQGDVVLTTITAPASAISVEVSALGAQWPATHAGSGRWQALIGIDLDTRPGAYTVTATADGNSDTSATRAFTVAARRFRTRRLSVAPEFVNPPPGVQARITDDAALLREVFDHSSSTAAWQSGFVRPVRHQANSSFGTRSVFNGEPRNPHTGTDFLSPAGTPVRAPAAGRVVVAHDLFFTGNTVVIDHGLGVFSTLAHLSRLDVHEGQSIRGGDIIGLVGATGRVTGAHLHWSLRVGNARVDPLSALALLPAQRKEQVPGNTSQSAP